MTAEELIAKIKAECEHNIEILDVRWARLGFYRSQGRDVDYDIGYVDGLRRFDMDLLEKIKEWEKENERKNTD